MASRSFLCRVRGAFRSGASSSSLGTKGAVASAPLVAARSEASALHGMMNAFLHADGRAALARSAFDGSRGLHSTAAAKTEQIFRAREGFGLAAGRGARRFHVLRDAVAEHVDGTRAALSAVFFSVFAGLLYVSKDADDQDEAQEDDHSASLGSHQLMEEMEREREAYCTTMPDEKAVVQEYMEEDEALRARFEEWMKEYGRTYKDEVEKARRFKIFKSFARCMDAANAESVQAGSSARFGLTEYADWNAEERSGLFGAAPGIRCPRP